LFESDGGNCAIDVSLHEMATDWAAGCERSLQVHWALPAERAKICAVERLFQEIESELILSPGLDRETASVDGYAIAFAHFFGDQRRRHLQLSAAVGGANPEHVTNFFDRGPT
jgi:hypothetical protein